MTEHTIIEVDKNTRILPAQLVALVVDTEMVAGVAIQSDITLMAEVRQL